MTSEFIFLGVGLIIGIGAVWFVTRRKGGADSGHQILASVEQSVATHMARLSEVLDRRLQDNVHAMNESKSFLANRVSQAEHSVREVVHGLGKLEQATSTLQRTNEEITAFQRMLKNPKIRGSFGEVLLANLLGEVLPRDRYELQYGFAGNREICDAIVRLQDGYIVAIDAKFPLANYELMSSHSSETIEKKDATKAFVRDVKKHIQDISTKYIVPQEKTLDYAFMYIPIEGVYYEIMVHDHEQARLWEYCLSHKVIPVSPNSFLAYLHTILIGLRGMKIEEQAKDILRYLGQIRQDMTVFAKDFTMIGTHLSNAKNRYDDSTRRFDRLSTRLDQIDQETQPVLPEASQQDSTPD